MFSKTYEKYIEHTLRLSHSWKKALFIIAHFERPHSINDMSNCKIRGSFLQISCLAAGGHRKKGETDIPSIDYFLFSVRSSAGLPPYL